jgi:hypothetical protein
VIERARGRPWAGGRLAPVAPCAPKWRNKAQEENHRRSRMQRSAQPAFPAQWFDSLCRALLGDEFGLPPSLRELTARAGPGWATSPPPKLGTSNGCQNHTVLLYATALLVRRGSFAHSPKAALRSLSRATPSASAAARTPRIVTTRTPLCMRRDNATEATVPRRRKAKYFSRTIWTGGIGLNRRDKFDFRRGCFRARIAAVCGARDVKATRRANQFGSPRDLSARHSDLSASHSGATRQRRTRNLAPQPLDSGFTLTRAPE